ncbi:hypothetical protein [Paenibacillus marinisediminis]
MAISIFMLGIVLVGVGLFGIKHPESWLFWNLIDDRERGDEHLAFTRSGGKLVIIMGVVIIGFGIQHLFI